MDQNLRIIDCLNLTFSPSLAQDRMKRAQQSLGKNIVQRLLCFALYLLGINRRAIGEVLGIPAETAKSIIKAVNKNGLPALEDRRCRGSAFRPSSPIPHVEAISVHTSQELVIVEFGMEDRRLKIPRQNSLQVKTILFSMLNSGLINQRQVADVIGLTPAYTTTLARRLNKEGVSALMDKRQGQKSDYRITPEVKAELVQQFALDIITRGKTSGQAISRELQKRCRMTIPARTVRYHLGRMGLPKIKNSLPQLVTAIKKSSNQS
jgi:transposase